MFGIKSIAAGLAVGALLGGGGTLALGGGALAIWSKTPWSATSKLDKARGDLVRLEADLKAANLIIKDRDGAIKKRDDQAIEVAKAEAGDATDTAAAWGNQCSAAFNAGVSAGRRISNASCASPAAAAAPDSVQRPSFRSEFEAERYTPAARGLPGDRQR